MTEAEIQKAIFAQVRERGAPDAIILHVPNDRKSRNKSGFLKGTADILAFRNGEHFAMELKADKGMPSEEQLEFLDRFRETGGCAIWVQGYDAAIRVLESWGLLQGRS